MKSTLTGAVVALALLTSIGHAQVAKGLQDPNVLAESDLVNLPHMTPAIAKNLVARRPFMSVVELNTFLTGEKLTADQIVDLYRKAFVHVSLNAGTQQELQLIPGASAAAMALLTKNRPWKDWAQYDQQVGQAVGPQEAERLKPYLFIPVNLNTATDQDLLTVPGAGPRMVREFKEYRPWRTKEQFDREIGKYVGPKETARFWRYMTIQ